MMVLTKDQIVGWLTKTADLMQENEAYLTALDAAIGDADHGRNMSRGFARVKRGLHEVADKDIGTILKTAALTLMSYTGGACGQLYAYFLLQASATAVAKEELSLGELVELFDAGVYGVMQRGRAAPGEKTIIDALLPAQMALDKAHSSQLSLDTALKLSLDAAEKGRDHTVYLQAKKGRASYLGERSVGHQDPGATSSYLILKALHQVVANG